MLRNTFRSASEILSTENQQHANQQREEQQQRLEHTDRYVQSRQVDQLQYPPPATVALSTVAQKQTRTAPPTAAPPTIELFTTKLKKIADQTLESYKRMLVKHLEIIKIRENLQNIINTNGTHPACKVTPGKIQQSKIRSEAKRLEMTARDNDIIAHAE